MRKKAAGYYRTSVRIVRQVARSIDGGCHEEVMTSGLLIQQSVNSISHNLHL